MSKTQHHALCNKERTFLRETYTGILNRHSSLCRIIQVKVLVQHTFARGRLSTSQPRDRRLTRTRIKGFASPHLSLVTCVALQMPG